MLPKMNIEKQAATAQNVSRKSFILYPIVKQQLGHLLYRTTLCINYECHPFIQLAYYDHDSIVALHLGNARHEFH